MTDAASLNEMFESVIRSMCDDDNDYRKLKETAPGAATNRLKALLLRAEKKDWGQVITPFVLERGRQYVAFHKPGDLWLWEAEWIWWSYYWELADAIKGATGVLRIRSKLLVRLIEEAHVAFVAYVDNLIDEKTGMTRAERKAAWAEDRMPDLQYSLTLDEAVEKERRVVEARTSTKH